MAPFGDRGGSRAPIGEQEFAAVQSIFLGGAPRLESPLYRDQLRKWYYEKSPRYYGVSTCPKCSIATVQSSQWSPFVGLVRCQLCMEDYAPEDWGLLSDLPVTAEAYERCGITFHRISLIGS